MIHDIQQIMARRYPFGRIDPLPCKVQGEGAAEQVVQAIELFNRKKAVDVLIVGRGGGSMEDLWAFNEEKVARAVAASSFRLFRLWDTKRMLLLLCCRLSCGHPVSGAAELAVS